VSPFNSPYPPLTAPGVILQDIALIPRDALMTGVPIFLGVTPIHSHQLLEFSATPKMLTLWTQFLQQFARYPVSDYLTHAVRGFFENGGRLCYVLLLPNASQDNPDDISFALTMDTLGQGLQAIEALNTIDLVCVPDIMQSTSTSEIMQLQALVLEHCDRLGDRFAILDSLNTANLDEINQQRQQLIGNNGAIYGSWIMVETVSFPIPPCGHIAGIYAQNDRESGVHRAPANYVLNGVLDMSVAISASDWQRLNVEHGAGVNWIHSFKSRGIRVWGARTVSQIAGYQYVNVRRLIITVLRWAEHNLMGIVFEPNDISLWTRIARELTVYCESLWQKGALQGQELEEAFYVKCDSETNPVEVRNVGQVVAEVGLAPTTPAEFIVISLVHGNSGITFA